MDGASASLDSPIGDPSRQRIESTPDDTFKKLQAYPFTADPEFAHGLSIILGHPGIPATGTEINRDDDDLVLQAKCFYFSRKEKLPRPPDFTAYKAWLGSQSTTQSLSPSNEKSASISLESNASITTTESFPSESGVDASQASTQAQEPTYPSSFAHIVELITTGQPIPGIQQIPDTVLTGHDSSSTKAKRRKPWEKGDDGLPQSRLSDS